jgi:hypothetical protein
MILIAKHLGYLFFPLFTTYELKVTLHVTFNSNHSYKGRKSKFPLLAKSLSAFTKGYGLLKIYFAKKTNLRFFCPTEYAICFFTNGCSNFVGSHCSVAQYTNCASLYGLDGLNIRINSSVCNDARETNRSMVSSVLRIKVRQSSG